METSKGPGVTKSFRWWLTVGGLAALYVGAAKLGIELEISHGVVTPVWIPTGLSIAAVVLLGARVWPAVALGAFVANATSGVSLPEAGLIAVGNTGETVVAGYLLRRAGFEPALGRVRDVIALVIFGALVAPAVSATNGITTLVLFDRVDPASFSSEWLLWWFGDVMGAVLVAPPLLAWGNLVRSKDRPERVWEGVALLALLAGASVWVFVSGSWQYPYLLFPLFVWAALRFRQVGASTAVLVVSAVAVWGTLDGSVPIGGASRLQSVQILQALLGVVAIATALIAATLMEREVAERDKVGLVERLAARERLNSTLLSALSDLGEGFLMTDAGRLTYANEAYCRMTGYSLEELMSFTSLVELSPPGEREAIIERLRSRLAGGQVEDHYEGTLIRKDGKLVTCEVAVKLMQTEEGPRLVSIVRDVTERKRMEVFRDEFLAYAAHELRGPISTIRGFIDLLGRRASLSPDDLEVVIERIAGNTETMAIRLERLMGLARVQRGDLELKPEPIKLVDVARAAASEVPAPDGKRLDIDLAEDLTVEVDRHAAEQILANLLTNAFRYGGANVRITAARRTDRIELSVVDDGEGVPEELQARLFQPFTQGPASKESGGAGLGLAMVRTLGEVCGLETGYAPATPKGSRFFVSFPAAQSSAPSS